MFNLRTAEKSLADILRRLRVGVVTGAIAPEVLAPEEIVAVKRASSSASSLSICSWI
jgi:hypothetical protein